MVAAETIYEWLEEVKDPEIPVLSIVDLGVITAVEIKGDGVFIKLTPTFVGCPALDMMKDDIREVLGRRGVRNIDIEVTFKKPWSSDMISEKGRQAIKNFGLAPPPAANLFTDLSVLEHAVCPRCNGENTELRSSFGPTLCRSIHYCNDCLDVFEQIKPV